MSYFPNAEDYVRAVQAPTLVFSSPSLRAADFALHPIFQIPMPASGASAVVFRARVDGIERALRFFIRDDASSRPRYDALERYFTRHGLTGCVAHPTWIDDAICVNSQRWPMVQLDWVNGRTLDEYVGFLAASGDTAALRKLADAWLRLVVRLQSAQFAHGDLQHGNVMVDESATLRLVDFDGSWIPEFGTDAPTGETGHPNYQQAGRTWGRWMDTFPGLLVYTALIALSRNPSQWTRLSTGENIVFTRDDFAPPFRTKAWTELAVLHDDEIDRLAGLVQRCCESQGTAQAPLQDIVCWTTEPITITVPPEAPAAEEPWWNMVARDAVVDEVRPAHPVCADPVPTALLTQDPSEPDPSLNATGLPAPPLIAVRDKPAAVVRKQSVGRDAAIALAIACALAVLVGMVVAIVNRNGNHGVVAGLITVALSFAAAFALLRIKR